MLEGAQYHDDGFRGADFAHWHACFEVVWRALLLYAQPGSPLSSTDVMPDSIVSHRYLDNVQIVLNHHAFPFVGTPKIGVSSLGELDRLLRDERNFSHLQACVTWNNKPPTSEPEREVHRGNQFELAHGAVLLVGGNFPGFDMLIIDRLAGASTSYLLTCVQTKFSRADADTTASKGECAEMLKLSREQLAPFLGAGTLFGEKVSADGQFFGKSKSPLGRLRIRADNVRFVLVALRAVQLPRSTSGMVVLQRARLTQIYGPIFATRPFTRDVRCCVCLYVCMWILLLFSSSSLDTASFRSSLFPLRCS